MKFLCASLVLICVFSYMPSLQADNKNIRDDAISCSAVYYVMTSLPDQPPAYGRAMVTLGQMMTAIYSVHESKLTGKRVLNGEVIKLRDNKAKELAELYKKEPDAVVNEYLLCDLWRQAIAKYASKQQGDNILASKDEGKMQKFMLNIPRAPDRDDLNLKPTDKVKDAVNMSFKTWVEYGMLTNSEYRKIFKNIIDKK